ncbi:MAG: 50S ribosomal protein L20 [Candidatus Latescibacterota bacterium]
MPRATGNVPSRRRRKKILQAARGFRGARSKLHRTAKEAVHRAWSYAYNDRKRRKRDFRRLWIVRINAAARLDGLTYSAMIRGLDLAGMEVNRKILADLAVTDARAFSALVERARVALG